MNVLSLMEQRHSVRQYKDKPIENEKRSILDNTADELSKVSGLIIKNVYDEEEGFSSAMAEYGNFKGVKNYIAIFGDVDKDEAVGYYGEKLVLKAQELGLNTCWVALTFNKKRVQNLYKDKKLYLVISVGYGETEGFPHKSKSYESVVKLTGEKPYKFDDGVKACLLAPTAINQQKFKIVCVDKKVKIVKSGIGFYATLDLGIVKCHFELATGIKVFND